MTPQPQISQTATAVLWLSTASVGLAGLLLKPPSEKSPPSPSPIRAQLVNVQIINTPVESAHENIPQAPSPADSPPSPPAAVAAPSMIAIAPAPQPARPAPPKNPLPLSNPKPPAPATQSASTPPIIQHLIYGQGEGQQPAPQYPRESVIAHQQGSVVIRFEVDEAGRVQSTLAISPCPWPLLNQAALRAVTDTWHFSPGKPRTFEVTIQFELRHR